MENKLEVLNGIKNERNFREKIKNVRDCGKNEDKLKFTENRKVEYNFHMYSIKN